MIIVLSKPKIPENYDAFCLASEPNNQIPRGRTSDLPFFFCHKHITFLSNYLSLARGESFSYWFRGNLAAALF